MGGVGFAMAALATTAASVLLTDRSADRAFELAVPGAAAAMLILGMIDDRLQLSPLAKLVSSLIVGALTVFFITGSLGRSLPWPVTLLAVVWFGGVVHALNLLDNMDGLAGGVALIATAFLAWLFSRTLGPFVVVFLVAVVGSLAGFLYWNRKPARLFMGDSGSLFLGGTLAAASLVAMADPRTDIYHSATLVLLVLAIPLFDTAFVLVLRRLAGRKATRGGTDHVSHRLVSLGFSERGTVGILYLLALSGGVIAVTIAREGLQLMLPVAVLFAVALVLDWRVSRPRSCVRRRRLRRVESILARSLPEASDVSLARRAGPARSRPDCRVLLRSVPHTVRGRSASRRLRRTSPRRCRSSWAAS